MGFAQSLAKRNPTALIDLVRILLRPLQSELLLTAIENEIHRAKDDFIGYYFFMPNGPNDIQMEINYPRLEANKFLVQLSRDPVLPSPWNRDRYVERLTSIGHGKSWGDWKVDTINHNITLWLPWGIAFVNRGNHSIAVGIVEGEGALHPNRVFDMSALLDLVECDGKHYRSIRDGTVLDTVHDYKVAALFEVGRLMRQHHITPMAIPSPTPESYLRP